MKVLILLSVFAVAFARRQCGENEHFESCGTACPLTCDNYDNGPKFCVLRCDIGCHCDSGYVRNSENRCVKPEECPAKAQQVCGENQRYSECGSACPLTCDNLDNPPKICPAMCVMGCACEKGYVKTRDGRCVRPEDCPSQAREVVKTCNEKPDPGMCMAYIPSWHFDMERGECSEFIYGGCQGNGNRYESKEECEKHCASKAAPQACLEDKKVGKCRAGFKRFFYNKETGKCEEFIYGGCEGNSNNFNTKEECEGVCLD